jgi:hypothetical protein
MTDTKYDPRITPDFVLACAKVGSVSVFSSQVAIQGRRELVLKTLRIPTCYAIEWIGVEGDQVKITLMLTTER